MKCTYYSILLCVLVLNTSDAQTLSKEHMRVHSGVPFLVYHLYINIEKKSEGPDKNFRPTSIKNLPFCLQCTGIIRNVTSTKRSVYKKKEFSQGFDANTTARDFWLGAIG
jgi:hypothetical protein